MTTLTTYRPNVLGRSVFDEIFNSMLDMPTLINKTTQGYPVADIYKNDDGSTTLEFALAGFSKEELNVEVKPEERTITVSAQRMAQHKLSEGLPVGVLKKLMLTMTII